MKKFGLFILILLLLVIGAGFYVANNAGSMIKDGVNDYLPEMTKTSVHLDHADISPIKRTAQLKGLFIGNPVNFKSDHSVKVDNVFISLKDIDMDKKIVHLSEITINNADMIYEIGKAGKNIDKIQQNIESYLKKKGVEMSEGDTSESEYKFKVDQLNITGTKVKIVSAFLGGKGVSLTLPDINMKNIGTAGDGISGAALGKEVFSILNKSLRKNITGNVLKGKLDGVIGGIKGNANEKLKNLEKDVGAKLKGLFNSK